MKAKIIPIIFLPAFFSLVLSSCEDTTLREYKGYAPVYMSYKDLRSSVRQDVITDLQNPGKIYFKDNYIFIVEELKGIHVYDNTDPANPVSKSFIKLPGVVDISISGSALYADSYIDLVVLDVSEIQNIHEVGRVQDILPYTIPATKNNDYPKAYIDKDKGVVTGWELRTIKEKIDENPTPNPYPVYYDKSTFDYYAIYNSAGASTEVSGSGIGIGGSMARFGIKDKVLYIVDNSQLKILDITEMTAPARITDSNVAWNTETMFLKGTRMYLGTTTGLAVYDISSPFTPFPLTFFSHARSCDPVIVDDTLAYVTLRSGTVCGGNQNLLEIINIKNISSPVSVVSYFMTDPHGLGKDGDLLFICDGSAGLKVYNASDPKMLLGNLIYTYPNIQAYDAIPLGKVLVLISGDGLFQYDYSNVKDIKLLSKIPVVKTKS
jgi:hypothetical protein